MNRNRIAILTAAAALVLVRPGGAAAQERVIPLDTVKAQATSRAATELASPTRAVEVVTAEQIRALSARTVADVLEWAVGVDVLARSPAQVDVALRGSSFEQVLVMVDGVRVSDAQTGHFDLDLAVPLDQVERIEILRGAASALHGSDALAGVINVVTRRGDHGLTGRVEAGSFSTAGVALADAFSAGGVRLDVAGDLRTSDGHRSGTDYDIAQARAALSVPLAGHDLRTDLAVAARDFGADGFYAPFPSYEETRVATATVRLLADPEARFALEPLLSVRRHTDDFILRRGDPEFFRNQHESWQVGGELTGRLRLSSGLGLATGVELYGDMLESTNLGEREEARGALIAELAAGEVGRLSGTAGVRADWHSHFGWVASPSVSGAWWPVRGLRLRASAGSAFRAPTWTDRFYEDPSNIGNPDLDPERSWSAELGADAHHPSGFSAGATFFVRDTDDLIDWSLPASEPDPANAQWRARNVENARFRGVEGVLRAADLLGLRWEARGEWLSVRTSDAAGFVSKTALRPILESVSLRVGRELTERLSFSLLAERSRRTGEDAYARLDAKIGYRIRDVRLYADLRNLTDAEYLDVTRLEAPGRSVFVGFEILR